MKLQFLCVLVIILLTNGRYCQKGGTNSVIKKIKSGNLDIHIKYNSVVINIRKNDGSYLQNVLFTKTSVKKTLGPSNIKQSCEPSTTCILYGNFTHTKVKTDSNRGVVTITRIINDAYGQITDCFKLAHNTEWFGGPQLRYQHWPIQHMYYEEEPYVPTHTLNLAIAERYWLSSKGFYVFVDEKDPLFLDQNNYKDQHLCLIAKNQVPYKKRETVTLTYEIGIFDNPRIAHENVIKTHFDKPISHPNERMVAHPIWSTWARYKVNVSEDVVKKFAEEIVKYGFNNSQIEIDDNWETCYGSAIFDSEKFPDVPKLINDLKEMKFKITLWIHPFINENCKGNESYDYALKKGYFVKNLKSEVHTTWWQGNTGAAIIDFTNPKAVEWWVGRLKKIQELGIDSFKFDAGEISWLPQTPDLTGPLDLQPGIYTLNYTTNLAKSFDDSIEARVGWRTQGLPIFIRMIDKDTRWTWNNGLPTLITTLLQMNLNGYVFVLPDMIGGNGYVNNSFNETVLPSKEIFIRWLQANVFMPTLQYSFVPWDFDSETIIISKKYTDLHAQIAPKIMTLMENAVQTGAPINPPIWWIDPLNVQAHKINDEYLLGEEILVAPVIEEGSITRDIYLPTGKWKDANTQDEYTGPIWLSDYSAPLNILPYFYKI